MAKHYPPNELTKQIIKDMIQLAELPTGPEATPNFDFLCALPFDTAFKQVYRFSTLRKFVLMLDQEHLQACSTALPQDYNPACEKTLPLLASTGLLTQDRIVSIVQQPNLDSMIEFLTQIQNTSLASTPQTENYFNQFNALDEDHQKWLIQSIEALKSAKLLSDDKAQGHFDTLISHPKLERVCLGLRWLSCRTQLLQGQDAEQFIRDLVNHTEPDLFASALSILYEENQFPKDLSQADYTTWSNQPISLTRLGELQRKIHIESKQEKTGHYSPSELSNFKLFPPAESSTPEIIGWPASLDTDNTPC